VIRQKPSTQMAEGSDSGSGRGESQGMAIDQCRELCDVTSGQADEGQNQLGQQLADESSQHPLDEGRTVDSVRSSLSNFRQSASRTTGQIRELLETSKALDRDLVVFLQDPQTRAFLEGVEDEEDDENLFDCVDEASSDNPKEIEALKQKTKSLKRKLRKWRKAARMALSEICPDISTDAQGDMTPGTMKNVLQKIRQLKSLTDRQTSIILTLTGQCEAQKTESDEKDALIMELLRNCNGIRPTLVKGDQPEKITGSGASSIEGMVTKRETIDYPLITAAEVEEVLTQTHIQFGSAHLIPTQISCDARPDGSGQRTEVVRPRSLEGLSAARADAEAKSSDNDVSFALHARPMQGHRSTLTKPGNVWWALAVGTAAGLGSVIMGNIQRRQHD